MAPLHGQDGLGNSICDVQHQDCGVDDGVEGLGACDIQQTVNDAESSREKSSSNGNIPFWVNSRPVAGKWKPILLGQFSLFGSFLDFNGI